MKCLANLNKKLEALTSRELPNEIPTVKDVLVESVGRYAPPQGGIKQSILIMDLAKKIMNATDSVNLENGEFELVKEALDQNGAKYFPFYLGQVARAVQDSATN